MKSKPNISNLKEGGQEHFIISGITFIIILVLGGVTLKYLNSAIKEREKSVDWWQRRLLKFEINQSK
jgi:hypothetical protein